MPNTTKPTPLTFDGSGLQHLNKPYPPLDDKAVIQIVLHDELLTSDQLLGFIDASKMWLCRGCLCLSGVGVYDPRVKLIYKKYYGIFEQPHHKTPVCHASFNLMGPEGDSGGQARRENNVDICWCCGYALIPSGTKWSKFFCPYCMILITKFNQAMGECLIPVGGHSLMNGVSGRPAKGQSTGDFAADFARKTATMKTRIQRLRMWHRLILHDLLLATNLNSKPVILLKDLDHGIQLHKPDRRAAFRTIVEFICGEKGDESWDNLRMPYTGNRVSVYYLESNEEKGGLSHEN